MEKAVELMEEKERYSKLVIFAICFILLNTIKLSVFNFMIISSKTVEVFLYKALFTLLINIILYTLFLKIRSKLPLIIFYGIQLIYIFSNLSYFSYFKNYLHLFQSAALFTEGVGQIEHFTIPVSPGMLIIIIDLPAFLYIIAHYTKVNKLSEVVKSRTKYVLTITLFAILSIEGWNYLNGCSIVQLNEDFFSSEPKIIERYGTIVNNISDIAVNYGGKNLIKHFDYGKTVSAFSQVSAKPNIICIQVESMDANIVNEKYNNQYVTPYLNSLTTESIYYPYTLSYHKSGGTSDSEFSIINSVEPLGNYPSIKIDKYDYPNSFIKILSEREFFTAAFHGNIGNYYNRDVAFPKMGFNEFYDMVKMGFKDSGWGAPDGEVFQYALNVVQEKDSSLFEYIITMSSHTPFTSVDDYYNDSFFDDIEEGIVRKYFKSMSYVDMSIKDFVEKATVINPNTYIFILGDHTPDINTSSYKQASYISGSDYFEFVPLFIITPDKKTYYEDNIVASFLDMAPTILEASGVPFSLKSDGINLINPPEEKTRIPFKGNDYDRKELYKRISELN